MLPLTQTALAGQYAAGLKMLGGCIDQAVGDRWLAPVGHFPFWHVAYHTLFFTDLYLSADERSFIAPALHRENYNFLGKLPWPPFDVVSAHDPYDRAMLLEYLDSCRAKARQTLPAETEQTIARPSGFAWLPFSRLELHLYNIRHLQHHTGQLAATLRREGAAGVGWARSDAL